MKHHVAKVRASCHYHLRRLRQIRRCVGNEVTIRLVLALVISRLDYCHSLLAGLPRSTLAPLQRVQNAAARLVFELDPRDHVTASLIQLHWLPVHWCIQFKLCCIMHFVLMSNAPHRIGLLLRTVTAACSRSGLRSTSSSNFALLQLRPRFGERSFSHVGPQRGTLCLQTFVLLRP